MESGIVLKKQWFITNKPKKIDKCYSMDTKQLLGAGSYGQVIKAVLKNTKEVRAIKIIPKNKVTNQSKFKSEIEILRQLDHPNVIKLYEIFEDQRNIYLVMEFCEGGELFDRIIAKGHFSEHEARLVFTQMMNSLNYCHSKKICHRDLKPENFLYLTKSEDSPIKVIDFGLSTMFDQQAIISKGQKGKKLTMTTKAGTPYYISPEVLEGDYDESCDIWSAGVLLYILLSGVPPFYGDDDQEILDSVRLGEYSFDSLLFYFFFKIKVPEFYGVSSSAKDLINKMLVKPKLRLTPQQVLQHPWMLADKAELTSLKQLNFIALKNFQNTHKLKKAALTYIASQLNENEIQELGKLFTILDKNSDGVLTVEEMTAGIQGKENYKELQEVLKSIDTDGNGKIDYTGQIIIRYLIPLEFIAATMEKNIYMKSEKLYMAFCMFDIDGSGKISAHELEQILGNDKHYSKMPKDYFKKMIKDADTNGDGEIDYNEFIQMMSK